MIECSFRTESGTCQLVDSKAGRSVPIVEASCIRCIANTPDESQRETGEDVRHYVRVALKNSEKERRDMELAKNAVWTCPHRRNVARPVSACSVFKILVPYPGFGESLCDRCQAKPEALENPPAVLPSYVDPGLFPTVDDPEERARICSTCPFWKQNRCRAFCDCKHDERPDPRKEAGEGCPYGCWRRSLPGEK